MNIYSPGTLSSAGHIRKRFKTLIRYFSFIGYRPIYYSATRRRRCITAALLPAPRVSDRVVMLDTEVARPVGLRIKSLFILFNMKSYTKYT